MTEAFHDPVHAPKHYRGANIEAIDYIESWALGYHLGNAAKYIIRAGAKGDLVEDLQKACWYLRRAVAFGGALQTSTTQGISSERAKEEFNLPYRRATALLGIEMHLMHHQRGYLLGAVSALEDEIDRIKLVSAAG